jgi:S-layer homology domain
MTNSSNPNPNPNRRRRLTADELIAIVVALTGIGSVLFWGLGQKNHAWNFLQGNNPLALNGQGTNQTVGLLDGDGTANLSEKSTRIGIPSVQINPPSGANAASNGTAVNPQVANNGKIPLYPALPLPLEDHSPATTTPQVVTVSPSPAAVAPTTTEASPVAKAPEFQDVPKTFWGGTYIGELQKRGILDDFGSGEFEPNKPVTRGEYAKMLDRAFSSRRSEERKVAFKDIPNDYPRKEAIDKSVKLGFMSGYSADKFAPNEQIPRYQMQISLAKGLNLPVPASVDGTLSKFADAKEMPKYAKEKMSAAIAAGLVVKDEKPDTLKPTQKATRADAAALIYESLVKEGIIKPQR